MKIRGLRITNFKALEDVSIDDIGNINVFCGKNNAGKSSIFEVLQVLHDKSIYPEIGTFSIGKDYFTGHDPKNIMKLAVVFELDETERSEIIKTIMDKSINQDFRNSEELKSKALNQILHRDFVKTIEYEFISIAGTNNLYLNYIKASDIKGNFFDIAHTDSAGPNITILKISTIIHTPEMLDADKIRSVSRIVINRKKIDNSLSTIDFFMFFQRGFNNFYKFSPSRRSERSMKAEETYSLSSDGSNLVQRLFTMRTNQEELWLKLKKFVESAFTSIGKLESRQVKSNTVTCFADKRLNIKIDIHDMGSGIEQLLMIAAVLISANNTLILVESPEQHLHAGAQRVLANFIHSNLRNNQVLINTHSPVFLNQKDIEIHTITKTEKGSKAKKVKDPADFSDSLNEIGYKNSDVLLADSVCFVEGPSDSKILGAWAQTLGIDFDVKNMVFVEIKGSRNLGYYANSDILNKISVKSPVPSIFIIDKDEKSDATLEKIEEQLKDQNLHVLEKREIENYFLSSPNAILNAIRLKAETNPDLRKNIETVSTDAIEKQIKKKLLEAKPVILLKKIKQELGGGPYLNDCAMNSLIKKCDKPGDLELSAEIFGAVQSRFQNKCNTKEIRKIVKKQSNSLNEVWSKGNMEEIMCLAPGKDILIAIYNNYGLNYNETKDGERIAKLMKEEDIDSEIKKLLEVELKSILGSPQ